MSPSLLSILEAINSQQFHTLSLDIFDTLMLRNIAPERHRVKAISEEFSRYVKAEGLNISWKEVYRARLLSSHIEYKTAPLVRGEREGRFDKIIELQLKALRLPLYLHGELSRIEIEYEKKVLRPNAEILNLCEIAKRKGKRIILISDMYLKNSDITQLLEAKRLKDFYDALYVSSELGMTKRGGSLFEHVMKLENLPAAGYEHIGDNIRAIFVAPKIWMVSYLASSATLVAND